ncbi:MAG TPA: DinB family protein [Thermoanaerobaculia bacterium]|nr:DinB family protein [Thermoanaerobaculia bacterium]
MTEYRTLLEEALEAWEFTREGVLEELRSLPEKDLGFRPSAESRSVIELAQHIVESGSMMAGELSRADGDFRRKSYEGFLHEYGRGISSRRTKAQLLDALRKTHADGHRKLRDAGELHMLQFITRFDGQKGTRLAWMQHGIAHEEYHRGQLALDARLLGRVPALTRKILGG